MIRPSLAPATVDRLLLDTLPWLSCDDCFARIDAYAEAHVVGGRPLDRLMQIHLLGCPSCLEEAESLIALLYADGAPCSNSLTGLDL